jgi:hypothetical protein
MAQMVSGISKRKRGWKFLGVEAFNFWLGQNEQFYCLGCLYKYKKEKSVK